MPKNNQKKAVNPSTNDLTLLTFKLNILDRYKPLVPPIHHYITADNGKTNILSPLTQGLIQQFTQKKIDECLTLDVIYRRALPDHQTVVDYFNIVNQVTIMCHELHFIIDHYDNPLMEYIHCYPRVDYIKGVADLLRLCFDIQFNSIKKLFERRSTPNIATKKLNALNLKISEIYEQSNETIDEFTKLLNRYEQVIGNEITPDFKFRFFHAHLEKLLFKAQASQEIKQSELNALGASFYIDKIEGYLTDIKDQSYHVQFFILKARIALRVNRNINPAQEYLALAKEKFILYSPTVKSQDEINEMHDCKNTIALTHLSILIILYPQVTSDREKKLTLLNESIDVFLFAKDSIKMAPHGNKTEYSKAIGHILNLATTMLSSEIKFLTLNNIDKFIAFAENLKKIPPLLVASALIQNTSIPEIFSQKHKKTIDLYIDALRRLKETLNNEAANNEKEFESLEKAEEEYNKQFSQLLAMFDCAAKKIKKQPKKVTQTVDLSTSPSTNNKPTETPPETPPETPSETPSEIFPPIDIIPDNNSPSETIDLNIIEANLDTIQHQTDEIIAMLYHGDNLRRAGKTGEALILYQDAFNQTKLQSFPNEEVVTAIKIEVERSKEILDECIKKAEAENIRLEERRKNFIIKLGLQELTREGKSAKELNLNKQAYWEYLFERGQSRFIHYGKKRAAEGKPLSNETIQRQQANENLTLLKAWLQEANQLIKTIDENRGVAHFPPLSCNRSSLFSVKQEIDTPQFKPVLNINLT